MAPKNKVDVIAPKEASILFLFSSIRLNFIVGYYGFPLFIYKEHNAISKPLE